MHLWTPSTPFHPPPLCSHFFLTLESNIPELQYIHARFRCRVSITFTPYAANIYIRMEQIPDKPRKTNDKEKGFWPQIDTQNTAKLRHIARVKIPWIEKCETQKVTQASLRKEGKESPKRPDRRTRACIYAPPEQLSKNNRHCRTYRGAKCAHTHHFPFPPPDFLVKKGNRLAHWATIINHDYSCSFRNTTT